MASAGPVQIFSDDPEVMALQALIKGLRHFGSKPTLTFRHFKLLAAVELGVKLTKKPVNYCQIESLIGVKSKDFEPHLKELLELRYLHEVHQTYGDGPPTYKLGSMGGTAMRTMFKHLRPASAEEAANV